MPDALTCPFCNAVVPSPMPDAASGRIICPRCDQAIPARNGATRSADAPGIAAEVERHRQARQPAGWRSTRGLVIGGLILAALGVGTGLAINYWNRSPSKQPPHVEVETAKPVAPLEMPGLAYLPTGTDSIVAVQFRPLLDALPANQARDPRALLAWLGLPADSIAALEKTVPIGLHNIDQLVLGLQLKNGNFVKQTVLVAHTHQPFSLEAIVTRVNAKEIRSGGRTIYQTTGDTKFPLDLCLWAPNDRVLVVALESKEIEPPHSGIDHLSPRLIEIAATQLTPDSYFWAVFDSENWEILGLPLLRLLAPEQRKTFESLNISLSVLRTVTLGVRSDPEPALTVWFELKSEGSAGEFRHYLSERLKDTSGRVAIGGAGNRVMLRTPMQSGELRSLIRQLLPAQLKK